LGPQEINGSGVLAWVNEDTDFFEGRGGSASLGAAGSVEKKPERQGMGEAGFEKTNLAFAEPSFRMFPLAAFESRPLIPDSKTNLSSAADVGNSYEWKFYT
jgi:hypothetical protein